ncbi:MAG: DUF342 domain-containing protein [Chitinivibrionales bacterium]|nr:DUF342 domain-containing protein [Chitinivibrionales bacterium]
MAPRRQEIEVSITPDSMSAFISGSVNSPPKHEAAVQRINKALSDEGVVYGVIDDLVFSAAKEICENGHIDAALVAAGDSPAPATTPGASFIVKTYDSSRFPQTLISASKAVYSHIRKYIEEPYIVKKGTVVGRYEDSHPEKPGINVRGETVPLTFCSGTLQSVNCIEGGLSYNDSTREITALKRGIVLTSGNRCRLLPVTMHGAFSLDISSDKCSAFVEIYPAGPKGKNPSQQDILDACRKSGIVGRLDKKILEKTLAGLDPESAVQRIKVAEGKYPVDGEDGRIEYKVNLNFSQKPKILPDGRADYYSIHVFENVVKGQDLARIIAPKPGIVGADVYGNPVPAMSGSPVSIRPGKNIVQNSNDHSQWIAAQNGHVYFRDGRLVVEEVLRIEGDVDFHTGNITFVGDVEIYGDVHAGFSVAADGNIHISGVVEDAVVESQQNVILKSGFIGIGKGYITAGKDVVVSYVRNQRILAHNTIMVAGEVIDSHLSAGKSILVESPKSWIIGGRSIAKELIRTHRIGNTSGVFTKIDVGVDYFIEEEIQEIAGKIKSLKEERRGAERGLKQLAGEETLHGGLPRQKGVVRARLVALCSDIDEQIESLRNRRIYLRDSLYTTKARIEVAGTVFRNVALSVAGSTSVIHDDMRRCLFYFSRSQVKKRSL